MVASICWYFRLFQVKTYPNLESPKQGLRRYWWRMLERQCVGDKYKLLVTVLAILVTNISYLFTLAHSVTKISKSSPTSSHRHHCHPQQAKSINPNLDQQISSRWTNRCRSRPLAPSGRDIQWLLFQRIGFYSRSISHSQSLAWSKWLEFYIIKVQMSTKNFKQLLDFNLKNYHRVHVLV